MQNDFGEPAQVIPLVLPEPTLEVRFSGPEFKGLMLYLTANGLQVGACGCNILGAKVGGTISWVELDALRKHLASMSAQEQA
jgi:hypothetical protein